MQQVNIPDSAGAFFHIGLEMINRALKFQVPLARHLA